MSISYSILNEVNQLIAKPHNHQELLNDIVVLVKKHIKAEVCSLYQLDKSGDRLVLEATHGLNQKLVGELSMGVEEGLTGKVIQLMQPIAEKFAFRHPRFKYFPELGEDKYKSFLGVPLITHNKAMGVLVVQHEEEHDYRQQDIIALVTIASQLSGIITNAELLKNLEEKEAETAKLQNKLSQVQSDSNKENQSAATEKNDKTKIATIKGVIGSQGIAIGKAWVLPEGFDFEAVEQRVNCHPEEEKLRLNEAIEKSVSQIVKLIENVSEVLSDEDSSIFHAHLLILEDKSLIKKIDEEIQAEKSAEFAVKLVIGRYVEAFAGIEDAYLKSRALDMKDIGNRMVMNLLGMDPGGHIELKEPSIVVGKDLTPSQLVSMDMSMVLGFVLEGGGDTSHVAILAKSFGIPSLIQVKDVLLHIRTDDHLVLDCRDASVQINASENVKNSYQTLLRNLEVSAGDLDAIKELPAITQDEVTVKLMANVGIFSELDSISKFGAEGIGLYRTEFYYLAQNQMPEEDSQTEFYERILKKMGDKPVTMRTLDIGGDKTLPYLKLGKEENPFLGWRSIRMSLDMEEVFRTQLRALLKAARKADLKIMLPMISGMDELKRAKKIFQEEEKKLKDEGLVLSEAIELGIMIEVPAAVQMANHLIKEVDFFSVGTNDLIQYTLAVDRNNPKVSSLYDPLHPAVLSQLKKIADVCNEADKPVSICGEMASDPDYSAILIGMGYRMLSLNSAGIPKVKERIRSLTIIEAEKTVDQVLQLSSAAEIRSFLRKEKETLPKQ
jgi:phosphotransferase system enzyme I (PtsP)